LENKMSEHTLERAGATIAYEDTDGDADRTVLLTHGFGLNLRMWDPTVPALVADGRRVVTWDLPDTGGRWPAKTYPATPSTK
jgi:pimeloyl-ACP methyl ester carboxylesterase